MILLSIIGVAGGLSALSRIPACNILVSSLWSALYVCGTGGSLFCLLFALVICSFGSISPSPPPPPPSPGVGTTEEDPGWVLYGYRVATHRVHLFLRDCSEHACGRCGEGGERGEGERGKGERGEGGGEGEGRRRGKGEGERERGGGGGGKLKCFRAIFTCYCCCRMHGGRLLRSWRLSAL